ncbi:hypothetical protein [Acaryochloris sp. IP29b_bin.137]|uniref:hypothetical protein n=1 Tax=Acaryochloris sp. IP29b_bin.137 TaxID=2969217 RepID=UPI002603F360|nr:hypothetical protein [Acaryochloris sp. IP29b_bin.137]
MEMPNGTYFVFQDPSGNHYAIFEDVRPLAMENAYQDPKQCPPNLMNEGFMIQSIQDYLAAWNAKTFNERRSLLQSCMTGKAIYIDPHAPDPVQGIDGMQALIEKFRARFDHELKAEGQIDMHHSVFRLPWRLQRDSGEILSHGLMVGDLTDAGLIKRIVQFVDTVNAS